MADLSQRARLKPLVTHIIDHWETQVAADMILGLLLNDSVLNAPLPDPRKKKSSTAPTPLLTGPHSTSTGTRTYTRSAASADQLDPIDPHQRYSRADSARLLGMSIGNWAAYYATAEKKGELEIIRENTADGRPRVFFMGSELIRVREKRFGTQKVA